MTKIVRIAFDDILFDPEEAGELLTGCQRRLRKMRFTGACASNDVLIALFEEVPFRSGSKIVLAPFRSADPDEICAEIQERYERGYTLRASFPMKSRTWAIYEVTED